MLPAIGFLLRLVSLVSVCAYAQLVSAGTPAYLGPHISSMAYMPGNPNTVYAAGQGFYKSNDGGSSWHPVRVDGKIRAFTEVLVDSYDPQKVIAYDGEYTSEPGRYFESNDAGTSWVKRDVMSAQQLDQFKSENRGGSTSNHLTIHQQSAGLWLMAVNAKLFRTSNAGQDWHGVPGSGSVFAVGDAFYRASNRQVLRSADGLTWEAFDAVPDKELIERFYAFPNGTLLVSTPSGWYQSRDKARTWQHKPFLSFYELRYKNEGPNPQSALRRDRCTPYMSATDVLRIYASCSDSSQRSSVPSSNQFSSADGGNTWLQHKSIYNMNAEVKTLPSAWGPRAMAVDPVNSDHLLVAWFTGLVFRSDDAGQTWRTSNAGLEIPKKLSFYSDYGLPYIYETPLVKAVIRSDMSAIDELLKAGADINAQGNSGLTALEWALRTPADPNISTGELYRALRLKGALVPPQKQHSDPALNAQVKSLMELAAANKLPAVVEDLMHSGWRISHTSTQENEKSALLKSATRCPAQRTADQACSAEFAGAAMEHWVNLHLSLVPRGESAQLVQDLVELRHPELALRVARFDAGKYKNPAEVSRLLKQLPSDEVKLKSLIVSGYQGRYSSIVVNGDLFESSYEDKDHALWSAQVLLTSRYRLEPEKIRNLVESLVNLNQVDRALKVLRQYRNAMAGQMAALISPLIYKKQTQLAQKLLRESGIQLRGSDLEYVSSNMSGHCDLAILEPALRAGFRLTPNSSIGSTMYNALSYCEDKPAEVIDSFLARIHRAGLRLPPYDWLRLEGPGRKALLRSPLAKYYQNFGDYSGGVGLTWTEKEGDEYLKIATVSEGYPAQMAGLSVGDVLLRVDNVNMKNIARWYVILHIRGKPGTSIKLTVLRTDGKQVVRTMRRRVLLDTAEDSIGEK